MIEIVITQSLGLSDKVMHDLIHAFPSEFVHFTVYNTDAKDQEELGKRLANADMAVITNYPLKEEAIAMAPHLQYLLIGMTGTDHVDLEACRKRHITTASCPGYSTDSVAEMAITMMLALLKKLPECHSASVNGKTRDGLMGRTLAGKKVGIIGTGSIGKKTAELAHAFGAKIYAFSRHENMDNVSYLPLNDLLSTCDIVSVHVPLTEETRHLIGEKELALMKPSAILVNTARGPIVDTTALADALKKGTIAGAAFDVLEKEPPFPSDHPLLSAPHVILTPHAAYYTEEALLHRAHMIHDILKKWITTSVIRSRIEHTIQNNPQLF
jgi:lactate dehydrogenase-like 2-hydroxyacid dehydrogenase